MNLKNCPNCQNQINPNDNICQYCGNHINQNISYNNNKIMNNKNKLIKTKKNIIIIILIIIIIILITILFKENKQKQLNNNQSNNNIIENTNKEEINNKNEEETNENKVDNTTNQETQKEDIESNNNYSNSNNNINSNNNTNNANNNSNTNDNTTNTNSNSNNSNNNTTNSNNNSNTNTNNNSNDDCPDCLKYVKIGNYIGMNVFDALKECDEKGIDTKVVMSYREGAEEYTVIEQNGEPGGAYIKDVGLVIKLTVQSKYKTGNINFEMEPEIITNVNYVETTYNLNSEIISMDKKNKIIKYGYFIDYEIRFINNNVEPKEKTYILELYDSNNNKIMENTINTYVEIGETKTIKDKIDITDKIKNNENYILKIK